MKRSRYLLLALVITCFSCENDINVDSSGCRTKWFEVYGTPAHEYGNAVCMTPDEGYIVCGQIDNFDTNEERLYVIRTGCNGNIIWEKTYSCAADGNAIRALAGGGFIIYGRTGAYDLCLVEIDDNGNEIWSKSYNQYNMDFGMDDCLEISSDNGFIMAGRAINVRDEIVVIKTDEEGNEEWRELVKSENYEYRSSGIVEIADGYLVAGQQRELPWDTFRSRICLIKINHEGTTVWIKDYEPVSTQYAEDILLTADNEIYILATEGIGGNVSHPNMVLKKVNADGDEAWTKMFDSYMLPTHRGVIASSLTTGRPGNLLLLGNTNEEQDILVIETDSEGNELNKRSFGVKNFFITPEAIVINGNDYGNAIISTPRSGCLITGFTSAFGAGCADVFLLKLNVKLQGEYNADVIPEE
ncbi:MAG: hypothetical protein JXR41_14870 [Bacteroidales bacterium]|nr:hypothetical protein [Bacteroidales bacterium]MBN2764374.1 hypothetical protein [Bacteroidales bacterium]